MRNILGFIVGAILGSLVGASVALLLAPMPGQELRYEIKDRATTFSDEVQAAAQARRAELEKQLTQLRAPRSGDIQVE
jgi:gas vesicle protein